MYSILIVDDEIRAVRGVLASIDWPMIQIDQPFTAYSMKQAKAVLSEQDVDILICDIEMPNGSGIDLLNWVNANCPDVISILLTCHADFEYARQAVQLGVIEYLLKPVHANELKAALLKAIKILEDSKLQSEAQSSYRHYFQLWSENQMLIEEHFWLDLIDGPTEVDPDQIHEQLNRIDHLELEDLLFQPVLFSIRGYPDETDQDQHKQIVNALRSSIQDRMFQQVEHGQVIPIKEDMVLILTPFESSDLFEMASSLARWEQFIDDQKQTQGIDITCYCDKPVKIHEIPRQLRHLLDTDRNNVIWKHKVINSLDQSVTVANIQIPLMTGWSDLLSLGEQHDLIREINQSLNALAMTDGFGSVHLRTFYHNFMQIVYSVLQKKGVNIHDVFDEQALSSIGFAEIQTIDDLRALSLLVVNRIANHFKSLRLSQTLVEQIKKFISDDIVNNPTREEIASRFFLHPDYLTRKFKKETGMTLSEYFAQERIRIAKDILINSSMPISDVVSFVGYSNMSHFSKIFRKATGMNPLDFRKNKKDEAKGKN